MMDFSADAYEFVVTKAHDNKLVKPEGDNWYLIHVDTREWGMSYQNVIAVWRRQLPREKPRPLPSAGSGH